MNTAHVKPEATFLVPARVSKNIILFSHNITTAAANTDTDPATDTTFARYGENGPGAITVNP